MTKYFLVISVCIFFSACQQEKKITDPAVLSDPALLHKNMDKLTEVIVHDIFSPPVSSRIYTYTSAAAYEAIRFQTADNPSLTAKLKGFPAMPEPQKGKSYNFLLAATRAFFSVAEKITFSVDSLKNYEQKLYADFAALLDEDTYNNSIQFGETIGMKVLERAAQDNYKQTRGMPKFIGSYQEGKWRPTPPDYLDAAEPYWFQINPLVVTSAEQFQCAPPPAFSKDKKSAFYKTVEEVYSITKNLTGEQREIARYWDDNPFVIEHSGHLMYGRKKITPVGHWIGITSIACKKKNATPVEAARAYMLTSVAIFDAIITCWKTKFIYEHVRPITIINESIDQSWQPFLQTPPFPEHTSGHSAISAAAATVLTRLFGNFPFEDTSDFQYIGMKRNFQSFTEAAQEASISRIYGGIHYFTGINGGEEQGKKVGMYVVDKTMEKK